MAPSDAPTAIREETSTPDVSGATLAFDTREWHAGDRDFVVSGWIRANADSSLGHSLGPAYYPEHRALAVSTLKRARVVVAHAKGEPDVLLGFAVTETADGVSLLHYVYVRRDLRRNGIARALLAGLEGRVVYTHRPRQDVAKVLRIPKEWSYNPYRFLVAT